MKSDKRRAWVIKATGFSAAVLACLAATTATAAVVTFDDLSLAPDSYFRTSASTTFTSGNATFFYDAPFGSCCWSGFSYSNRTDTTTAGFGNDGSAITGDGVGPGQDNYAVSNADGARLEFATTQAIVGAYFTNATYSFLAMRDGDDGNTPPFVKGPFGPGDFFTLTVTGYDAANASVGSLEIALADGASILDNWTWVDLASLGLAKSLGFSYASSDMGAFGVNTPSYFAMDNLTTVPAPGAAWLLATGLVSLIGRTVLRRRGGA
ncbi:MAG: DUF4465 domain-containing protein [Gammaproteobacteria bacterium]